MVSDTTPAARAVLTRLYRPRGASIELYVASDEDTVITEMRWSMRTGSDRQLQDVAGIVRIRGPALDRTLIASLVSRFGLEAEWAQVLEIADPG